MSVPYHNRRNTKTKLRIGFLERVTLRTRQELRGSGLTGEYYAFVNYRRGHN